MADDPLRAPEASFPAPSHLSAEEQAVYEELCRAQAAIDAAIAALDASRDARARALLLTVKDQAAGLRQVLEWQARHRGGQGPQPSAERRDKKN
jgi:hypothetical protein